MCVCLRVRDCPAGGAGEQCSAVRVRVIVRLGVDIPTDKENSKILLSSRRVSSPVDVCG